MPNSASSSQTKVSPRKFSEKIALLVQKEAEGNAQFEEIIKEVQATRNLTTTARTTSPNAPGNRNKTDFRCKLISQDRDELKEVYEDFIKSSTNNEIKVKVIQHRKNQDPAPPPSRATDHTYNLKPLSTGSTNVQTCVSSTHCSNQRASLNYMVNSLNSQNMAQIQYRANTNETNSPSSVIETDSDSVEVNYRPRVISVGSAHKRHLITGELNHKNQFVDGTANHQPFLHPCSYEKNCLKSCSAPSLNSHGYKPMSYTMGNNRQFNHVVCSNSTDLGYTDISRLNQCFDNETQNDDNFSQSQGEPDEYEMFNCSSFERGSTVVRDGECSELSRDAQNQIYPANPRNPVGSYPRDYEHLQVQSNLPGIQICPTDDDTLRSKSIDINSNSNANVPPVNSNVQYHTQGQVYHSIQPPDQYYQFNNQDQLFQKSHDSDNLTSNDDEKLNLVFRASSACSVVERAQTELLPHKINEVTLDDGSKWSQKGLACWSIQGSTNNSYMFNSDHGLAQPELRNIDLSYNIMRSHSHGGINYLSKHQSSKVHDYSEFQQRAKSSLERSGTYEENLVDWIEQVEPSYSLGTALDNNFAPVQNVVSTNMIESSLRPHSQNMEEVSMEGEGMSIEKSNQSNWQNNPVVDQSSCLDLKTIESTQDQDVSAHRNCCPNDYQQLEANHGDWSNIDYN